ncbi:MAG TPA: CRTAC1 family protein, partial [Terriglobales bacterium]|nr:CRTAC1 family protein [Terriglobales bacterium]
FDNEMIGLYRQGARGDFEDVAITSGVGGASRRSLGFGCLFADMNLDGALDLIAVNGHIDDSVRAIRRDVAYAQSPQLFLNSGQGKFEDVAATVGSDFNSPKVGRGLAVGDFDRDGDLDVLITTNNGPAFLYRTDLASGNRSIRFDLTGTTSNRDGIGARVQIWIDGVEQTRLVHSGSSYLSQSQLSPAFGVGKHDRVDRAVITWPSGRVEEFKNLQTGTAYGAVEGSGIKPKQQF